MFGIFKRLKEIERKLDNANSNVENLTIHLAVESFEKTHKPMFVKGSQVGDFTLMSDCYYITNSGYNQNGPNKMHFGKYVTAFYLVKNARPTRHWDYPSPIPMSEFELFKSKNGPLLSEYIKLTTKK